MTSTIAAVTQVQSLAAIRNFVRASISCITYARGLCSDDSFEQRPFLGIAVKHMVPSSTESVTISDWIEKGAFDALNKNYLKEMALCVYNQDCTELLESYCFGFTYSPDGQRARMTLASSQQQGSSQNSAAMSESNNNNNTKLALRRRRCSKQEVQGMLLAIMTKLVEVVESLPPLVSERVLTMRLIYYDDVTPSSYEPPCFAPASERMVRFYHEEQKYNVSVGSMDTSHHIFSVSIRHPILAKVRDAFMQQGQEETASVNSWENEEDSAAAATASVSATAGRPAGPRARGGHPADQLGSTIQALIEKASPLSVHEVSALLLVAFVFAQSCGRRRSSGRRGGGSGHHIIPFSDIAEFLRVDCPVNISTATVLAVMQKLTGEGFVKAGKGHDGAAAAALSRLSASPGALGDDDCYNDTAADEQQLAGLSWSAAGPPPPSVMEGLLAQRQVTELLTTAHHEVLRNSLADAKQSSRRRQRISCSASSKKRFKQEEEEAAGGAAFLS